MKTNEQLMQILGLCLEINPSDTKQELTGNKPTVFFEFSGHCQHVQVRVFPQGWNRDCASKHYAYQTFDMYNWVMREDEQETSVTINQVIADLQRIKQEVSKDEQ